MKSVRTHLPYDYYDLPFCEPDEIKRIYENLGEILAGDEIENSPYELYMDRFETCKMLCRKKYNKKDVKKFKEKIDEEYSVNWVVDNLPAATVVDLPGYQEDVVYEHGYYLGGHQYKAGASALDAALSSEDIDPEVEAWYLNNHISIKIKTHSDSAYVVNHSNHTRISYHSNTNAQSHTGTKVNALYKLRWNPRVFFTVTTIGRKARNRLI